MKLQLENAVDNGREVIVDLQGVASGGTVLHLDLNRPAKRNALNLAVLEQLNRGLEQRADVIVLTGRGPAFCAGLDLDECRRDPEWPRPRRHLELLRSVYERLLESEARTFALVQGFAVGGGVGLAACADVVIASSDARLRIPQGDLAPVARIVQPIIEARQIARYGQAAWLAGDLDVLGARSLGLVDEILEPDVFAALSDSAWRDRLTRSEKQSSWRQADCSRTILEAMRAILTDLSRSV